MYTRMLKAYKQSAATLMNVYLKYLQYFPKYLGFINEFYMPHRGGIINEFRARKRVSIEDVG